MIIPLIKKSILGSESPAVYSNQYFRQLLVAILASLFLFLFLFSETYMYNFPSQKVGNGLCASQYSLNRGIFIFFFVVYFFLFGLT
jgi:hypothetical protein